MNTAEFNKILRVAVRDKDADAAATLLGAIRRKVTFYIISRGQRLNVDVIDDVTNAVVLKVLERKKVPDKYHWKMWVHFLTKTAWSEYCRTNFSERPVSLDQSTVEMHNLRESGLPVPMAANARMMEEDGIAILRKRTGRFAPQEETVRELWEWAVNMLIDNGKILTIRMGQLRTGLSEAQTRQTILHAVLSVRHIYEEMFGGEEIHAVEECSAARELAEKIF